MSIIHLNFVDLCLFLSSPLSIGGDPTSAFWLNNDLGIAPFGSPMTYDKETFSNGGTLTAGIYTQLLMQINMYISLFMIYILSSCLCIVDKVVCPTNFKAFAHGSAEDQRILMVQLGAYLMSITGRGLGLTKPVGNIYKRHMNMALYCREISIHLNYISCFV